VVFQVQWCCTSVKDAKCLVCPTTRKPDKNGKQAQGFVLENRRTTIHEVANMPGISSGSLKSLLKVNLNMHEISIKFVPSTITFICL
jgi:hypothetical protein